MLDPEESPGEIKSREVGAGIRKLDCPLLQVRTVAFRTLSLWLCSAQLLKQQLAEYTSCLALARSPPA